MKENKKDIRSLTKQQLRDFFLEEGDKAFRGDQVYEWLWSKAAYSFDEMTNVSKGTRQMLENNFVINHIRSFSFPLLKSVIDLRMRLAHFFE